MTATSDAGVDPFVSPWLQGTFAVVVLDAGTLDEVARVHLPRRVPFGFHGSFLP